MSIYYGLRRGAFKRTSNNQVRHPGKRFVPAFDDALAMATPIQLKNAIAHMQRSIGKYQNTQYRIERMTRRLQEIEGSIG